MCYSTVVKNWKKPKLSANEYMTNTNSFCKIFLSIHVKCYAPAISSGEIISNLFGN